MYCINIKILRNSYGDPKKLIRECWAQANCLNLLGAENRPRRTTA
jgi:hypothetical protein